MAGPQSFTPKPVKPSRPQRRFTLEEANKSLSLVRRIVGDIVRSHAEAVQVQAASERAAGKKEQASLQVRLEGLMEQLEDYVDELAGVGCELKDHENGLIDFIGTHQGRDVYLCWKLGEEKITHWHELDAGFAGRQPVSTLKEKNS